MLSQALANTLWVYLFIYLFIHFTKVLYAQSGFKKLVSQLISYHFLIDKAKIQGFSHIWAWWVLSWQDFLAHVASSSWNMLPLITGVSPSVFKVQIKWWLSLSSVCSLHMWCFTKRRRLQTYAKGIILDKIFKYFSKH